MARHCTQCGDRQAAEARFCARCGTAQVAGSGDALVGKVIADRYLITDKIGQGSSGTIYRAEHTTLQRKIAIKILHHALSGDEASVERFRREATTIGQIDNDHLLSVTDFGRTPDQRLFFAMELLEGETLEEALRQAQRLEPARAVKILAQIADALAEAHAHGYIHRDLRPRNIFLSLRRGQKDFVKLLDFGLAKLVLPEVETRQTALGMNFGDPHYMSPEQARGDTIDPRSDVFSLGAVAYELLVGAAPFEGSGPFDVLQKVLEEAAPRVRSKLPEIPTWLDALVARCLQKRPGDRFETMALVAECLRAESAPPLPAPTLLGLAPPTQRPAERATPAASSKPSASISPGAALAAAVAPAMVRPAPAAAPLKPSPSPSRTLIMPTALPASVAAAAQAAGHPASVPPPDAPEASLAGYEGHDPDQTNPGRKPPVRELVASTAPSEAVSGEMHAPTQVTAVVMEPEGSNIVVEDEMHGEPTGSQRAVGDEGWFSDKTLPPIGEEEFDDEIVRARRKPLVIGAIVGGLSLAAFMTVLLWPKPPKVPKAAVGEIATQALPTSAPPTPPAPTAAPEPVKPEPVKPEPVKPEPVKPEPVEPEPVKPEPVEPVRVPTPRPKPATTAGVPRGFKDPFAKDPNAGTPSASGEADALIRSGRQKLGASDLAQAQSAFTRARELDTHNADAYAGLGEVAFEQGDYASAATHLKQALRMSPNRARFLLLLGQSYYKQGRAKEAAVEYRRALKVDPTNQEAQRSLELAEKKLASGE